jgi:hypothetical protein
MCFRDVVYHGIKINVKNVVIELINREREGEQIDRALLRNIVNFFVEMGMDRWICTKKTLKLPCWKILELTTLGRVHYGY